MGRFNWIRSTYETDTETVNFLKKFQVREGAVSANIKVSAIGVYEARIGGKRIGNDILTPGFTSYKHRVQYQTYDVTDLLCVGENELSIAVAPGWAVGNYGHIGNRNIFADTLRASASLEITYADGKTQTVVTDETWETYTHEVTFSDIYDGETVDKTHVPALKGNAICADDDYVLVDEVGAKIREQEVIAPVELIVTPKGERVIDFGQNMTGYVSLKIKGKAGDRVVLSFAEVFDSEGNFYNANYRLAKSIVTYILSGEEDFFKPRFSFQGFRYVRIDEYPDMEIDLDGFRAIVVHSEMKRTGNFVCGDAKINQLYHNIIWGQKSNYLDIPTDCPQRDERLGWTGDAQVFCRTAGTNFDVSKFFEKWLGDLRFEQGDKGEIYGTCPSGLGMHTKNMKSRASAGWGDVATIAPWTLYELYGDKKVLADNFEMMKRWVEYIRSVGDEEYLWLGGYHYGDWLAMDAGGDSYVGATSNDLVASAFYAYSTELLVKAGEVLGKDMTEYRELYSNIVKAFRSYFMENGMPKEEFPLTEIIPTGRNDHVDTVRRGMTQTAIVLILHFRLCTEEERAALAQKLAELIHGYDDRMSTGFLGTPYILHVLSDNGMTELAYKLLFNEGVPSWLYSVNLGATTMWEHWNSIKEDGSFWHTDMNSFNHYAYGAVGDWLYGVVAGVKINGAGYKSVTLAPKPCQRLGFVDCSIDTVRGALQSNWYYKGDRICFEFVVPEDTEAKIVLPNGYTENVRGGTHHYEIKA